MSETLVTSIPALRSGRTAPVRPGPVQREPQGARSDGQLPMNGHLDPDFWDLLLDLTAGLQALWRRADGLSLCFSASRHLGHGGGPREPHRTRRQGHRDPRRVLRRQDRRDGQARRRPSSSSSPRRSARSCRWIRSRRPCEPTPTRGWSAWCTPRPRPVFGTRLRSSVRCMRAAAPDALLLVDAVTSLGGEEVSPTEWGIDYAYSCSQKSLGCPPGLSPFSVSPRALERAPRPQGARLVQLRHRPAGEVLGRAADDLPPHDADPAVLRVVRGHPARARGGPGEPVGAARGRRPLLPAADARPWLHVPVRPRPPAVGAQRRSTCPRAWTARTSRRGSCATFSIEVGGGLGPTAPPIWRVGLMGVNANRETADRVLAAFDDVLPRPVGTLMARKDRLHRSELAVPGTNVRAMEKAPRSVPTSCSSTSRTRSRPTTRSRRARNVIEALGATTGRGRPSASASTGSTPTGATATSSTSWRRAATCSTPCWSPRWARPPTSSSSRRCWTRSSSANGWEPGRIGIHILIETAAGMANVEAISRARARTGWRPWCSASPTTRRASGRARRTSVAPTPTTRCSPTPTRRERANALGRPVALRDQPDGGGLPRRRPAPDRRPVRRLQRRRTATAAPARRAAALGCEGKWAIHPSQIELANEVFTPSEDEVDRARRILAGDGGRGEGGQGRRLARRPADRRRVDPHGREPDRQVEQIDQQVVRSVDGHPRVPGQGSCCAATGVTTPRGEVVYTSKAAARVAEELGGQRWVVKAQIHAGGRGKAGGVKLAAPPPTTIAEIADQMLGSTLVTAQTGPEGQRVSRVLVERASRIEREFYLSLVVDRDSQRIVVIASAEGGVDIEEVAGSPPRGDPQGVRGPRRRTAGLPVPQGRDRDRAGQPHRLVHAAAQAHLPALPRPGLPAARGQPLHRDRGRRPGRPRREDELRRQRAVPPGRRGGAARLRRGRPQGGRGRPATGSTTSRSTARWAAS